jgi:cellulose synthase/poly-beta-1,6-N-acetylglucosamine synthase-like glycosyltransferase
VISPFAGLPTSVQVLFWIALAVIIAVDCWTCLLFARGRRVEARAPTTRGGGADTFTWVFLVPALNEELTIRDSVERLLAIPVRERHVLVIDDASDDATANILRTIAHPDLHVVRRELPHARRGKAAALNHAYAVLPERLGDVDRENVIVVVVDADGRLDPTAAVHVSTHFADPAVGGVQALVRIYNRRGPLTWCQDVEFSVYGHLYQAGRNSWGTAGMGGNGQFNRLSALDDVSDLTGPWRDRLTEDQDLGLRLIARGWKGRQELRATVAQQGLSSARALVRQRTRWSQGNLQAVTLTSELVRAPVPLGARVDLLAQLLMPLWQGIIGATFLVAVVLTGLRVAPFWGGGPSWQLLVFYALAFGGTIVGCVAARRSTGVRGLLTGFLIGNVYALYTWLLWPVLVRSVFRQLTHRRTWSKTEREPIEIDNGGPPGALPHAPAAPVNSPL